MIMNLCDGQITWWWCSHLLIVVYSDITREDFPSLNIIDDAATILLEVLWIYIRRLSKRNIERDVEAASEFPLKLCMETKS